MTSSLIELDETRPAQGSNSIFPGYPGQPRHQAATWAICFPLCFSKAISFFTALR